ncbi:putative DNa-binding protein [Gulosibacter sp. 10]|nr:putative DNa-binding protein [Gulosibacter sp. 10]
MLDVALSAGISPETLRKIESGRVATPAFPTVAAIAVELGLSLDEIWQRIGRPEDERLPSGRELTGVAAR